jgi:hypothetical protein
VDGNSLIGIEENGRTAQLEAQLGKSRNVCLPAEVTRLRTAFNTIQIRKSPIHSLDLKRLNQPWSLLRVYLDRVRNPSRVCSSIAPCRHQHTPDRLSCRQRCPPCKADDTISISSCSSESKSRYSLQGKIHRILRSLSAARHNSPVVPEPKRSSDRCALEYPCHVQQWHPSPP